jgi:hypothetical protein
VETVTAPSGWDQKRSGARELHAFGCLLTTAALCCLGACKPTMVVGEYKCPESSPEGGSPPSQTDPIAVPWETGFENQRCDYEQVAGFCYSFPPVVFRVVASPVHSGEFAAAITVVTGTDAGSEPQGRCVRQGVLPAEAYYGAWFYIPTSATNTGLWNLFHFQGGHLDTSSQHGLWDVSLANGATGELNLHLYDFLNGNVGDSPPIPVDRWFHVVFYLKRAKDRSGRVALYLNETRVVELTNLVTDDTEWGQWYVGDLASALQPPESTVYLDDVTIRTTL